MSPHHERAVYQLSHGFWANRRTDTGIPSSKHPSFEEAVRQARGDLAREGGGHLRVFGHDGQVVEEDTVAPQHDPRPDLG